jgi:branched-chain amino acid transport system permease protein
MDQLRFFAQQLINGVTLSSIYVLVALSATVVFGLTGIVNFGVGAFLTIGAFITIAAVHAGLPFGVAVILAILALVIIGLFAEAVFFRWTLPRPENGFIVSLGLIIVIEALIVKIWGSSYRSIGEPLPQTLKLGSLVVGAQNVLILAISITTIVVFTVWLYKSRQGRALRAASEDREVAQLMGIPATRLTALVFAIGIGFAGLAGALVSSITVVDPFIGGAYLLKGFIIAIVGGLGNIKGAFIVAIVVAVTESISAQYLPIAWTDAYVAIVMIAILLIRPAGLFGIQRG